MAKVRVVLAEVEGSDEIVGRAIYDALARFNQPAEATPVLIQAAEEWPILETAAPAGLESSRRRKLRQSAETTAARAAATPPASAELTVGEQILALLKKRPLVTGDILKALPAVTSGTVYQSLVNLRKGGRIETREDESDGYKKNFVV